MGTIQGAKYYITKSMGKAIMDYGMIVDGDKIAAVIPIPVRMNEYYQPEAE